MNVLALQLWILTGAVSVLTLTVGFWISRFIRSTDDLAKAVNGIKEYISSQDEKNRNFAAHQKRNDESHKEIYKRLNKTEQDIIRVKAAYPNYLDK